MKNLKINIYTILGAILVCFFLFFGLVYYEIFIPVDRFPTYVTFTVEKELPGNIIFQNLVDQGYLRNVFWAKVVSKIFKKNKFYRGEYTFNNPASTYEIVTAVTKRPDSLAVLVPDGFTKYQVADRLEKYIRHFDREDFLRKAPEGYLFPETYYFYTFSTNDEILKEFSDRYNQNMLTSFGKLPTHEEIIIASMIEREAKDPLDMKIISGIIQNRLNINMPLQLDATALYGQKIGAKDTDYNTYKKNGLPIGPIANPGLNAISAALYPENTKYMYYLTGRDGKMYYAVTHDEHVKNIRKYLR